MLRVMVALYTCVSLAVFTTMAQAQVIPAWMKGPTLLSSELAMSAETTAALTSAYEPLRHTRRSSYLLVASIGLVTAGIVHAGLLGSRCPNTNERRVWSTIPAGVVFSASGLAMTVAGVPKLRRCEIVRVAVNETSNILVVV